MEKYKGNKITMGIYKLELTMHFDNETYANNLRNLLDEAFDISIKHINLNSDAAEIMHVTKASESYGWKLQTLLGFKGESLTVIIGENNGEPVYTTMTDYNCCVYYYDKIINDFMEYTIDESNEEENNILTNQIKYHLCKHDEGGSCSGVVSYVKPNENQEEF